MQLTPQMNMLTLGISSPHLIARPACRGHTAHRCARAPQVVCLAGKARSAKSTKRRPLSTKKGFGAGKAAKQAEPWEEELLPSYRVYYKPGFKPSRYLGPIDLKKFEDGTVGVVTVEEVTGAELLSVSTPLVFLAGTLGTPPSVEDLHVAMLEAELEPAMHKVLSYLPRRPAAAAAAAAERPAAGSSIVPLAEPAAAAAAGSGADSSSSQQQQQQQQEPQEEQQQQQQQQQDPNPAPAAPASDPNAPEVPPSFAHLLPSFWEQVGTFSFSKLSSRQLMRLLQASCWSEEFQDPAASQVRHERPAGFIGVWPEVALLRHSCTPNTSALVVDRYLLLHATCDMPEGEELTFNKLGAVIAAPLAARQAAHGQLFGTPCGCARCTLECSLPEEVAQQLQSVYDRAQCEWPSRLQAALEGAQHTAQEDTADLLADLQAEVSDELASLDASLAVSLPLRDDRLAVLAGAYAAHDLAWQMEELLSEEPDLDKLANCVALLRLFARGSEGHVYTSLILDQSYSARAEAMQQQAATLQRKTLAKQRRLTLQIQKLLAGAEAAAYAYAEAISCRYGMLPQEGLIPQLEQGLTMFYAGLSALSAAKGEGLDEVPEVTRNLNIDGISVTVVDIVEGSAFAEAGEEGVVQQGQRLKVDWLEAADEGQEAATATS